MKVVWLCVYLLITSVSCSENNVAVGTQQDTSVDAATDQNTGSDANLDQHTELDSSGDTPDASDMHNGELDLSCSEDPDCGRCAFQTAPKTAADCYCTACDTAVLPVAVCQANQAEWERVCGNDDSWQPVGGCPQARCVVPPPTACMNDICVDTCAQTACPTLNCPLSEQVTPDGECCPVCDVPQTCTDDSECSMCSYPNLPTQASECECPICPTYPTTAAECQARESAFTTHCDADFQATCPVARCLPVSPSVCGETGSCEESSFKCETADDCEKCEFEVAPRDSTECACPRCSVPMSNDECSAITQQINTVCTDFNFDACIPEACVRTPDLICDLGGVCVYDK